MLEDRGVTALDELPRFLVDLGSINYSRSFPTLSRSDPWFTGLSAFLSLSSDVASSTAVGLMPCDLRMLSSDRTRDSSEATYAFGVDRRPSCSGVYTQSSL